jgi:hypothetical protein
MLFVLWPLGLHWLLMPVIVGSFCIPLYCPGLVERISLAAYLRRSLMEDLGFMPQDEASRRYQLHLQLNLAELLAVMQNGANYMLFLHVSLAGLVWLPAIGLGIARIWWPLMLCLPLHLLLARLYSAYGKRRESRIRQALEGSDLPGRIARGELAVENYSFGRSNIGSAWMSQFRSDGPDYSFAMTVATVAARALDYMGPGRRAASPWGCLIALLLVLGLGIGGTVYVAVLSPGPPGLGVILILLPFYLSLLVLALIGCLTLPGRMIASRQLLAMLRERLG